MLRLLIGCPRAPWRFAEPALSDQPLEIKIGYLHQAPSRIRISLIDVPAANDGLAGAQLATEDDNATGRFLNQRYTLIEKLLGENDDPVAAMQCARRPGVSFIVTSLDADRLLKIADAGKARGETLINALALDERLREQDCRANVFHVAPTRSMLADALAQYLVWKKWRKWMLTVRFARKRRVVRRRAAPCCDAVRRQDRRGAGIQGHRRGAAHRQRGRRDSAANADGDAKRARSRRAGCGGRERGLCRLSAVPDLGPSPGRRFGWIGAHHMGRRVRSMGRRAVAEPLHEEVPAIR